MMMTPDPAQADASMLFHTLAHTIPAAYALLPAAMDAQRATAMLLAIGLQESAFEHRRQVRGPARGYWQFELGGGVVGVLMHPSTHARAAQVCKRLGYLPNAADVYIAIEHNDVLACCFARLLLWTLPDALPGPHEYERGWAQYLNAWRPGKPHAEKWRGNYGVAWSMVQ